MLCATPVLSSGPFGHVPETAGHVADIAGHDRETAGHLRPKYAHASCITRLRSACTGCARIGRQAAPVSCARVGGSCVRRYAKWVTRYREIGEQVLHSHDRRPLERPNRKGSEADRARILRTREKADGARRNQRANCEKGKPPRSSACLGSICLAPRRPAIPLTIRVLRQ
jgi:hypothetical protein